MKVADFKNKFKLLDQFGQSIRLTFQGKDKFQTVWGAIGTLIMVFILLLYGGFSSTDIGNKILALNVNSQHVNLDSQDHKAGFTFNQIGFKMGFGIPQGLDKSIGTIVAKQVMLERNDQGDLISKQKKLIKLKDCDTHPKDWVEQKNSQDSHYTQILRKTKLQCYEDDPIIKGEWSNKNHNYVQIEVYPCKEPIKPENDTKSEIRPKTDEQVNSEINKVKDEKFCKTDDEIQAFFTENHINFMYTDSYINQSDQKNNFDVVKYYLNDRFSFSLQNSIIKKAEFYLQSGEVTQNSAYIWENDKNQEKEMIYKMKTVREHFEFRAQDSIEPLFKAKIMLDNSKLNIKQINYTMRTWLAEMGGIFKIVQGVFFILCFFIGRVIFMNQILGETFLLKPFRQEKPKEIEPGLKLATEITVAATQQHTSKQEQHVIERESKIKQNSDLKFIFKEEMDYYELKKHIKIHKQTSKIGSKTIENMYINMMKNRVAFYTHDFTAYSFIKQKFTQLCPCLRKKQVLRDQKRYQQFTHGQKRYYQQLDVVKLIQKVRNATLFARASMSDRQQLLLSVQRQQVISSDSSDFEPVDYAKMMKESQQKITKDASIQERMVKIFAQGKIYRILQSYKSKGLNNLDKNLLQGFYIADPKEIKPGSIKYHFSGLAESFKKETIYDKYLKQKYPGEDEGWTNWQSNKNNKREKTKRKVVQKEQCKCKLIDCDCDEISRQITQQKNSQISPETAQAFLNAISPRPAQNKVQSVAQNKILTEPVIKDNISADTSISQQLQSVNHQLFIKKQELKQSQERIQFYKKSQLFPSLDLHKVESTEINPLISMIMNQENEEEQKKPFKFNDKRASSDATDQKQ